VKRFLALVLAVALVLGFAATVFAADVNIGGEMRVRHINKSNYDWNSDAVDSDRYYDQRLRLKINAKAGEAQVISRITVSEGTWGTGATWGSVDMDNDDLAYIVVPVGPVTLSAGRMHADWGNRLMAWNVGVDRLKLSAKLGAFTVGGFTTKATENGAGAVDVDDYAVFGVGSFGDWKAALLVVSADDRPADQTGSVVNLAFNGKAGAFSIAGEIVTRSGDLYDDTAGNGQLGAFVAGDIGVGPGTVSVAVAHAANGFAASNYFTPTLALGTTQPTAMMEFNANDDSTSLGVVAGYGIKLGDDMNVGLKVAHLVVEDTAAANDTTYFEVDATLDYNVSEGTTYKAGLMYITRDDDTAADYDAAMGFCGTLQVNF